MDLKDELMAINEKLIWGTKGLHIVSVVGMPGLGKTTIARKVYNDPSIIHHFHRRAWCCVSQVYKRRELYFDILTDVMGVNARQSYSGSTDDDLAEKLWKCLRQQRYLVILDDIWNLEAWKCIQQSFPDDDIGSRILFTSRIRNLMAQANLINCSVHPLRSLSDEESWEILKGKLSRIHTSPLDDELSEIAKNVAKNCQGLPLSVVLIADDDFPHWVHDSDLVSNHSSLSSRKYGNYCHLCTDDQCTSFVDDITASPFIHSLVAARKGQLCVSCPSTIFECFKCLNVLELEHISIPGGFPEEVTLLVLLRYLRIHLDTAKILPSIANLWNLEVLILKFNWDPDFSLPSTFWGMKQLRHVSIPWWRLTYGLEDYEYCQLEQLEILAAPFLQMGNETQELLRRLPRLRKLKCYFPFVSNSDNGRFPEMSHLTHLESLNVMGCRHTSNGEEWSRFIAFNFPYSLRKFTLKKCNLPWSGISIIEELPHLEVLKLRRDAFSGNRWHVEDGKLLKLKYLELQRLDIEEWTVDDDPFPCLEQLIVESCEFLFEIPSGLGYITTLKKIEMRECSRASNSARKIFEEQREYGNDLLEVVVDDEYLKQLTFLPHLQLLTPNKLGISIMNGSWTALKKVRDRPVFPGFRISARPLIGLLRWPCLPRRVPRFQNLSETVDRAAVVALSSETSSA
ncbi:OLC1v1036810C1 [Oldenlandia corymbosa var. corymbosa]|uniref:OLC1v1036810C1 n=1 Tax=Oldenlandia corymbosa var. corymbosa TaxID=529605 RepID=A0AAV1CY99_OLDCO|nr:OLC1v1036810C1 [Oldenlandia corymbosa var. corymbosa]